MRKILIAAAILAAFGISAADARNARSPGLWTDALATVSGRYSICRQRLEAEGHPYPSLRGRRGRGILNACSRALYLQHREAIRAYHRRRA
jgi:hypothetical protein